jgi:hypothetical protein
MSAAPLSFALGSLLAFSPWSVGPTHASRAHASTVLGAAATGPEDAAPPAEPAAEPAGDDNGWGEEDTVAPADPTAPPVTQPVAPVGPAPDPTQPIPSGFNADGSIIKRPAPEPDPRKGIGLLVGAGVAGAVAWGVAGARIGLVSKSCVDTSDVGGSILDCVRKVPTYLGLTILVWLANDSTYALGPAAGLVRGRYEAGEYMYSGKYDRKPGVWAGTGGAIMGVGIISKVALWALSFNVLKCDPNDPAAFGDCVRKRWTGMLVAHQFASGMIAGGAGAMTFGIVYGKERRSREKLFFRPEQVRLVPELSNEMAGMALVGRF